MNSSKLFGYFAGGIFLLLFVSVCLSYGILFRNIDQGGGYSASVARLAPVLANIQEQIHNARSADEVKRLFKTLDNVTGQGGKGDVAAKMEKMYGPFLGHLISRPKETESRYLLIRKKEVLEAATNNYRQEVSRGDLRVRAILLNLIFDTQNSLLSESTMIEEGYIKRSHERIVSLRTVARGGKGGLAARINTLDDALSRYDRAFTATQSWQEQRDEILAKAEKDITQLLREMRISTDGTTDQSRRSYLRASAASLLLILVSLGLLVLGYRISGSYFLRRAQLLGRYLKQFGQEKQEFFSDGEMASLRDDEGWASLLHSTQKAEEEFANTFQIQLSVCKTLGLPLIVFSKEKQALFWNKPAANLFGLPVWKEKVVLDDILNIGTIAAPEGDAGEAMEAIRNSFSGENEDVFFFLVKRGYELISVELRSNHIDSGPLAGGKLYLFRENQDAGVRPDRALGGQLTYVNEVIQKMAKGEDVELKVEQGYSASLKNVLTNLQDLMRRFQERETLWKSEGAGLLDQVDRQREILMLLQEGINEMRAHHEEVGQIFQAIYSVEEEVAGEIISIEQSFASWSENRRRLKVELDQQSSLLRKARVYETALRKSVAGVKDMFVAFETEFQALQRFREDARVQAINLSFAGKTTLPADFPQQARSFAGQLGAFCDRLKQIIGSMEALVNAHPAAGLFPSLESADIDVSLVARLQEEHLQLGATLEKWKLSGEEILSGGKKAISILDAAEKLSAAAARFGETSAIINEQAKSCLSRWQ